MAIFRTLTAKIIALTAVAIFALSAAILAFSAYEMNEQLEAKQGEDGVRHIRTLGLVYGDKVRGVELAFSGDQLNGVRSPDVTSLNDLSIVDNTVAYVGGTATVFAFDAAGDHFVRRITTVKKENGERAVGTSLAADHPAQSLVRAGKVYRGPAMLFGQRFLTVYHPTLDANGQVNGILFVGVPSKSYDAVYAETVATMARTILSVAFLVCLILSWVAVRLFRPIRVIAERTTRLVAGDFESAIPHREARDEVGEVARALEALRDTSLKARALEAEQVATHRDAQGRRASVDVEIARFRGEVAEAVQRVGTRTGELRTRAAAMMSASASATHAVEGASMGSREASMQVQTVAGAAEELAASIIEIGARLDVAKAKIDTAFGEASTTNERMGQLAESARRIETVVVLIRTIAEQTNLLALNATIEAARAGEAGRGFAVVAAEVKALANQTAKATDEIASQVAWVQTSTVEAVDAIGRVTEQMGAVSIMTTELAASVSAQGAATDSISRNVANTASTSVEIARDLGTIADAIRSTATMAEGVQGTAISVEEVAAGLEDEIGRFLKAVAA